MNQIHIHIKKINDWFEKLDHEEQSAILHLIDKGLSFLLKDLNEENKIGIRDSLVRFIEYTENKLKEHKLEDVDEALKNEGLHDSVFRKKMIHQIHDDMSVFYDSQFIREMNTNDFSKFIRTTIKDMYVDRKYRKAIKLCEELGMKHDENVDKSLNVIRFVLGIFYKGNLSFDDLNKILQSDLGLTKDKSNELADIVLYFNDNLEKYFLFEYLREVRSALEEISVTQMEEVEES